MREHAYAPGAFTALAESLSDVRAEMRRDPRARKTLAVALVAMMLAVAVLPFMPWPEGSSQNVYEGEQHTVTYTDPTEGTANGPVTVTYYGIASTEYNPEYWESHFVGHTNDNTTPSNWKGPEHTWDSSITVNISWGQGEAGREIPLEISGNVKISSMSFDSESVSWDSSSNTIEINDTNGGSTTATLTLTGNKVFGGWFEYQAEEPGYNVNDMILPGDVLEDSGDGEIVLIPNWVVPNLVYSETLSMNGEKYVLDARTYSIYGESGKKTVNGDASYQMFSNIVVFDRDTQLNDTQSLNNGKPCTYRSINVDNKVTLTINPPDAGNEGRINLGQDTVIDNVNIVTAKSRNSAGSHGSTGAGLYAACNTLILGTNIGLPDMSLDRWDAPQVYGGWKDGKSSENVTTKLIIHSGYYYNVAAGHRNGGLSGDT